MLMLFVLCRVGRTLDIEQNFLAAITGEHGDAHLSRSAARSRGTTGGGDALGTLVPLGLLVALTTMRNSNEAYEMKCEIKCEMKWNSLINRSMPCSSLSYVR